MHYSAMLSLRIPQKLLEMSGRIADAARPDDGPGRLSGMRSAAAGVKCVGVPLVANVHNKT